MIDILLLLLNQTIKNRLEIMGLTAPLTRPFKKKLFNASYIEKSPVLVSLRTRVYEYMPRLNLNMYPVGVVKIQLIPLLKWHFNF
jgi:hypothetical protein